MDTKTENDLREMALQVQSLSHPFIRDFFDDDEKNVQAVMDKVRLAVIKFGGEMADYDEIAACKTLAVTTVALEMANMTIDKLCTTIAEMKQAAVRRVKGEQVEVEQFTCELCDTAYATEAERDDCMDAHVDDDVADAENKEG